MKDIMLRIVGRQIDRNDEVSEETVEFMTEGKAYKKGGATYLVYEESEMSGLAGVKTTLRIGDDGSVRMKRFGSGIMLDTVMEFHQGKRFDSVYETPYGAFPMEILTNSVVNDLEPERITGNLFIDYEIALRGLSEMRSLLNIEVTESSRKEAFGISDPKNTNYSACRLCSKESARKRCFFRLPPDTSGAAAGISCAEKRYIMKRILNHIFIDGLSGMASGLFATLIIGTILGQVGVYVGGTAGGYMIFIASAAKALTGAGIGVGIACKYQAPILVAASAAVAGTVGAYAGRMIDGSFLADGSVVLAGAGDPLGAFIASVAAVEIGILISGRTGLDIVLTPVSVIAAGSAVGIAVGPPCSALMTYLGELIIWATEQQPFLMGIVVAVVMGMLLTLPISSAAFGVMLGLGGISAGAATVGCAANMIGFAVASFRENGMSGLISQGIGTSMLQVSNIMRRPVIWLPAILSSAVLGPVSTCLLTLTNNAECCGMGTSGLVGPVTMYQTMTAAGGSPVIVATEILIMLFAAPAVLSAFFASLMRKWGWIRKGDMKLDI